MKRLLPLVVSAACCVGGALAAPVTVTLDGAVVSGLDDGGAEVSATLVYDPAASSGAAVNCVSTLIPCFDTGGGSQVYDGAVQSFTISIGDLTFASSAGSAFVVDDVPLTDGGAPSDGVSLGLGAMTASVDGNSVYGFFATSGLSFVDSSGSALSGLALEDIDLASGLFEILDTELYLFLPFIGLETWVIDWDEDSLKVEGDEPLSTPLPMSAWLMLGPVLAWSFFGRRRRAFQA